LPESPALVSVIVPAYNGERTVLRTLSSIVRQKYRPLQLIVVDDASRDLTASLVEDFVEKNGFLDGFRLVRLDENLGLSRSLNNGIQEADGDFVLVLHQDCELVGDDWVERALALMVDERVAVVTGYYGISDRQEESFVKRAFGVLRKQFHSRPPVACEEVTFSEGKCDLYRKDLLLKIGGFPTDYRIAGEDLIVSYGLRSLGYGIVKCYDLPVVQRFGGAAESFWGNIGKEFLFGKVMGGVFSEFKLFLFKGVKSSEYSGSRSLHRASQPAFVLALLFFALFSFLFAWWFVYFLAGLLLVRYLYYVFRVYGELKVFMNPVSHPLVESLVTALIGILTDFMYVFGFGYGLIRYSLVKRV
jgi:glycosyltransferase involved in cell wall biosynthesis